MRSDLSLHTIHSVLWALLAPLAGGDEVVGQSVGEVVAVTLHLDQVHGQGELVAVQRAVPVYVRQAPNLGQHRVGQPRLDHLLLGHGARDLPLGGPQRQEDLVPLPPLLGDHPLRLPGPEVNP